jgi:hypothetical protein
VPRCDDVRRLATGVDSLVAARGRSPIVLGSARLPRTWPDGPDPGQFVPDEAGSLAVTADVPAAGTYEVWLQGSVRPTVELFVDGELVGDVRHQLNNSGFGVRLGSADLDTGRHEIEVRFDGADLAPGSGGAPGVVGPLIVSRAQAGEPGLVEVGARQAERLCGRRWDWIEGITG